MDVLKTVGIFAAGSCVGILAVAVLLVVLALKTRPQEHADSPEAGKRRAQP